MNVAQVAQVNPSILAPMMGMGMAGMPQQSRQAKRLYVGNVPREVSEEAILNLFNDAMIKVNKGGDPPIHECRLNREKCFAFLEFLNAEDATKAMGLDGITIDGHSLKVRRPKDYTPAMSAGHAGSAYLPGIVSTNVPDTPNKIFIGGLPLNLNEDQVKELLQAFGPLRAFNLVKDSLSNESKGYAFFEYVDPAAADEACNELNGMQLGDKSLLVQRANVGSHGNQMPAAQSLGLAGAALNNPTAANLLNLALPIGAILPHFLPKDLEAEKEAEKDLQVLVILNAMSVQELMQKAEYMDLQEDMKTELSKFGEVEVLIPSPVVKPGTESIDTDNLVAGVGKVFACFTDAKAAHEACEATGGRRFGARTLLTTFMSKEDFVSKIKEPYAVQKKKEAEAAAANIFTMKDDLFFDDDASGPAAAGGAPPPPPPDEPAPWEKDEPAPWERGF